MAEEARDDEREALIAALFYDDHGKKVFKYADPRIVLDDDEFIPGLFDAIVKWSDARKHPEPEITDEVSRLKDVITEARDAWWSAAEFDDGGGIIYADNVEEAMDAIWFVLSGADEGGPRVPVEEGENRG